MSFTNAKRLIIKFSVILIKSYLKREGKNRWMCNKLDYYFKFCQGFENSSKADTVQKPWALDNGTENTHSKMIYQKKQSPTTLPIVKHSKLDLSVSSVIFLVVSSKGTKWPWPVWLSWLECSITKGFPVWSLVRTHIGGSQLMLFSHINVTLSLSLSLSLSL